MKAYLSFNLSSPEDADRFKAIVAENGPNLKSAMWSFSQEILRKFRKYEVPLEDLGIPRNDVSETACRVLVEKIETAFYETLEEYGASIE